MHRSPTLLAVPAVLLLALSACGQTAPSPSPDASTGATAAPSSTTAAPGGPSTPVPTATGGATTPTARSAPAIGTNRASGATTASGAALNDAEVGSCWADATEQDTSSARQVPCSQPHTLQVIASKDVLAVGDYNGDELARGLTDACYSAAAAIAVADDQGFSLHVPTKEQWDFAASNGASVTETCGILTGSPTTGTLPPATPR